MIVDCGTRHSPLGISIQTDSQTLPNRFKEVRYKAAAADEKERRDRGALRAVSQIHLTQAVVYMLVFLYNHCLCECIIA